VRFDTTIAYTNNPYSGSMRGYGNLESTFAVEAQMDELADRLGLDRLEIRRRNATQSGDANPQGFVIGSCAMRECLDAAAEAVAAGAPPARPGWQRGIGYAAMFHVAGGARIYRSDGCGAIVKLDDFGKVSVITGATEIGQGSETVLAMIVAETLGVPLERVDVVNSDTAVKPWDVGAHASRTTFIAGNAARLAAEKLRGELLTMAAAQLEEPAARWWRRRSTIRRRRCSTRICAATSPPPTASPPRRCSSTSSPRPDASRCAASPPLTMWAARSIRSPPRGRSTAASTWGSATR
jgi:xanthine dehydrogenase molybdenum-binding subunit